MMDSVLPMLFFDSILKFRTVRVFQCRWHLLTDLTNPVHMQSFFSTVSRHIANFQSVSGLSFQNVGYVTIKCFVLYLIMFCDWSLEDKPYWTDKS